MTAAAFLASVVGRRDELEQIAGWIEAQRMDPQHSREDVAAVVTRRAELQRRATP